MRRTGWTSAAAALVLALAVAGGTASISSCYDPPQPACGFRCGPGGECPDDYTCADDGRCHRDGTSVVCETFDAAVSDPAIDAATDAAEGAGGGE